MLRFVGGTCKISGQRQLTSVFGSILNVLALKPTERSYGLMGSLGTGLVSGLTGRILMTPVKLSIESIVLSEDAGLNLVISGGIPDSKKGV